MQPRTIDKLDELIAHQRCFVELDMSPQAILFLVTMHYIGFARGLTLEDAIEAAEKATGIDRHGAMREIDATVSLWRQWHPRPATVPGHYGCCGLCHRHFSTISLSEWLRDDVWLRLWEPSSPEAWMCLCDRCVANRAIALGIHLSPADLLRHSSSWGRPPKEFFTLYHAAPGRWKQLTPETPE